MHGQGLRLEQPLKGEPHFTLSQVTFNDVIMIFAFASIVGLLLGLSKITVPWDKPRGVSKPRSSYAIA